MRVLPVLALGLLAGCGGKVFVDGAEGGGSSSSSVVGSGGAPSVSSTSASSSSSSAVSSSSTGAMCCAHDELNPGPKYGFVISKSWVAFRYVPTCDVTAEAIDAHVVGDVAVLADANGRPGAILFEQDFYPNRDWRNREVAMSPPLPLTAGTPYWVALRTTTEDVSITASPDELPPFFKAEAPSGRPEEPWDGPWTGTAWTVRFSGSCP